jgi:2,4-dienoyl-CoA reductase-like NADH-dependent reductase (Old Yellow Enzyme family)
MGRVVHPDFLDGDAPVSASATQAPGDAHTYAGKKPYARARALTLDEIPRVIEDYRRATVNAMEAGFDGVQLHAANGYLVDQFLRDGTNERNDGYGGSIENRLRFLIEATKAIISVAGAGRTSVRLSPNDASEGCAESDMGALFPAAATVLDELGIALLEMRNARAGGDDYTGNTHEDHVPAIRRAFKGMLALNSSYSAAEANAMLAAREADAFAFGRRFLANPDLPARLKNGAILNAADEATFYSQGPTGYLDYKALV